MKTSRLTFLCVTEWPSTPNTGHCKTYRDTGSHQIGLVIGFRISDRVTVKP